MVDQHKALAVTTQLTDTVSLVRPTGIRTVNPLVSKQQPCILPLSYLVLSTVHVLISRLTSAHQTFLALYFSNAISCLAFLDLLQCNQLSAQLTHVNMVI